MSIFFVEKENVHTNIAYIVDKDDINHIVKVLRKKKGSEIDLCDGFFDYKGRIVQIDSQKVKVEIESKELNNRDPEVDIFLFQCVIKNQKMDFIIQKATELGARYIVPVISKRVVVDICEKEEKKITRWQKIASEAQKQCLRPQPPHILKPIKFKNISDFQTHVDLMVVPYEKEQSNFLRRIEGGIKRVGILIGPEGGFEDDEIEKLMELSQVQFISLGRRILRAETAAISAISIVMNLLGEM